MEQTLAVDRVLAGCADCAVALVDQDQLFIGHAGNHAFRAASFAALALSASTRLSRLTTKRAWLPVLIWSISSLAETSNTTLRRSTAVTVAVISMVEPKRVAAGHLDVADKPRRGIDARLLAHESDGAIAVDGDTARLRYAGA